MQQLVMPEPLAGAQIECKERIAKEVVSFAIAAPQIECGGSEREISDAALLVDCELGPRVCAARSFPRIGRPRVVAELSRTRDRMEGPHKFAGQHVERANVTGRRVVAFTRSRSQHQQIAENLPRRSRLRA